MSERIGMLNRDTECFPGPNKECMLHLSIKPGLQANARDSLPSDRSPNKLIVDQIVEFNSRNALKRRSTTVSKILMLSPPGFLPASSIANCAGGAIRCWMKAVGGIYPTADYLHRIGKTTSAKCPYCSAERETLIHFTCWCPRFHDARTEAHNRAWRTITAKIQALLMNDWTLHVETPMLGVGLALEPAQVADPQSGEVKWQSCSLWRPDDVAISHARRKIGILDLYRCSDSSADKLGEAHNSLICSKSTNIIL